MLKCTISGSFRRFYKEICETRRVFEKNGIIVLSPAVSKIINPDEDFPLLETDKKDSTKKEIEDMHLKAIEESDFLYVVCPDGYIGNSTRFEIGYAHGKGIPIYSSNLPKDILLRDYVKRTLPEELCNLLKK